MSSYPALRLVGDDGAPGAISELFHRVNKLLPDDQELEAVSLSTPVREAVRIMRERGYSQVPVVESGEVLGMFSFRSLAIGVLGLDCREHSPGDMPVEEVMDVVGPQHFTSVNGELHQLLDPLDQNDWLLVGVQERPQGIVTATDVLRHLYGVAHPFVLLADIELGLRALIGHAADEEAIAEAARRSLGHLYREDKIPVTLEEMTFGDYIQLVGHGANWNEWFAPVFGGRRETTRARLEAVRILRNDLFHFRRELTDDDHGTLLDNRDRVLMRIRCLDAHARRDSTDGK